MEIGGGCIGRDHVLNASVPAHKPVGGQGPIGQRGHHQNLYLHHDHIEDDEEIERLNDRTEHGWTVRLWPPPFWSLDRRNQRTPSSSSHPQRFYVGRVKSGDQEELCFACPHKRRNQVLGGDPIGHLVRPQRVHRATCNPG